MPQDRRTSGGTTTIAGPGGQRIVVDERKTTPTSGLSQPPQEGLGALARRVAAAKEELDMRGLDDATEEELYGYLKTPRSQPSLSLQGLKDAAK